MRKQTTPLSESQIQHDCLVWFRLQYPKLARMLFAVPNGGKRDAKTGARMKYEGAVRGVADLILLIPKKGWASLCIEMKTPKGTQSEHQRTWQTEAERYQNKYVICLTTGVHKRSKFLPTMTYIDYVNQFWKTHQSVAFSSNEVYLYFFLLNECNSRGWENRLSVPTDESSSQPVYQNQP